MNKNPLDYSHPVLNEEVTAIGGHYVVTDEKRFAYQGAEVLYTVGHGIVDRTCCGFGAFCYATVAGYVEQWKYAKDAQGREVSRVIPITRERDKEMIRKQIKQKESMVNQVNFLPPA